MMCDIAKKHNIDIVFEFHGDTLADTLESSLKLIKDVDRKNLGMYFQQDPFLTTKENCKILEAFLPYLEVIHVFNVKIDYQIHRYSIGEGIGPDMWRKYLKILKDKKIEVNLLFEFLGNQSYFKYPQEVRTLIYITNAIEGFNRQLRKVTKSKGVFPTDDSLLKMLYLAMMDITKKWTGKRREWGQIHSQLEIFFADRLN